MSQGKPLMQTQVQFSHRVTMDDVVAAYRLFLRRPPEPDGYRHFRGEVEHGMSLERLVSIFMESSEFRAMTRAEVIAVELGGYSVCLDSKDTDFAPGILYNRDYEPHVRAAIRERFQPGQTFVDIGANIGCISFLAASIAGREGRVYSFEPNPNNLQRLYAGIVLNKFENVKVMPYAVSDRRTTFSLGGGTSNSSVSKAGEFDSASVFVQSVVPDQELAHVPTIDFIKIDIEGHEPHALKGCVGLIEKHNPTLLTEFAPNWLGQFDAEVPRRYLEHIFSLYRRVRAITQWGDSAEFDDPESVLAHWHTRDAELAASGELPAGALHFDLIATNG